MLFVYNIAVLFPSCEQSRTRYAFKEYVLFIKNGVAYSKTSLCRWNLLSDVFVLHLLNWKNKWAYLGTIHIVAA